MFQLPQNKTEQNKNNQKTQKKRIAVTFFFLILHLSWHFFNFLSYVCFILFRWPALLFIYIRSESERILLVFPHCNILFFSLLLSMKLYIWFSSFTKMSSLFILSSIISDRKLFFLLEVRYQFSLFALKNFYLSCFQIKNNHDVSAFILSFFPI